ncbi:hypothetical protein Q1695_008759 [Nippostrongylus brasiliensis]|nr:hypothetical protein Q1695_008759 [Nippostrongylus brasiliensis]
MVATGNRPANQQPNMMSAAHSIHKKQLSSEWISCSMGVPAAANSTPNRATGPNDYGAVGIITLCRAASSIRCPKGTPHFATARRALALVVPAENLRSH